MLALLLFATAAPPRSAHRVAAGVYVQKRVAGHGALLRNAADGAALLNLTACDDADRHGCAASVEEVTWRRLAPHWRAALAGARIGDERTVWFCSAASKREWRDWAKRPCVLVDVVVVDAATSRVR